MLLCLFYDCILEFHQKMQLDYFLNFRHLNCFKIHSEYVALTPTNKLDLFFTIGVPIDKITSYRTNSPSPENFSGLPFFDVISNTEDNLPPNLAGILPL